MEDKFYDSFGTPIIEGDFIVYTSSYNRGSTDLIKSQIVSFTKGGNPRVLVKQFDLKTYRESNREIVQYILAPKALTCKCAKAFDSVGI